jgi:hypothetical protein
VPPTSLKAADTAKCKAVFAFTPEFSGWSPAFENNNISELLLIASYSYNGICVQFRKELFQCCDSLYMLMRVVCVVSE